MTAADLIDAISTIDRDQLPALMLAIAARIAEDKPAEPAVPEPDDTNLSMEEAAARLRRSAKWLYRHRTRLPFVRKLGPRSYVCSKNGLDRWVARQHA
jgi:predicted DNA-binding transcriptional regulator AlpA